MTDCEIIVIMLVITAIKTMILIKTITVITNSDDDMRKNNDKMTIISM